MRSASKLDPRSHLQKTLRRESAMKLRHLLPFLIASLCSLSTHAQQPEPTPAFPGQTDLPAPAAPSSGFKVETVTAALTGPWGLAFLPDGSFLVSESRGVLRTV